MKLSGMVTRYSWRFLDEENLDYDYADMDMVCRQGREQRIDKGYARYEISIHRVPKGKKRDVYARLMFDDNAEYQGIKVLNKYVTKKQTKEWETEALEWLIHRGHVSEV